MITFSQIPNVSLFSYSSPQPIKPSKLDRIANIYSVNIALENFYMRYHARRGFIVPGMIKISDLLPRGNVQPEMTSFSAYHDTFLFTEVICRMAEIAGPEYIDTVYDLGAGSSLPMIAAFLRTQQFAKQVVAIDIDVAALEISRRNVARYNLANRFLFKCADMIESLPELIIAERSAISANPPYLPVPASVANHKFTPVDGGVDGTKYLETILLHPMPVGTYVSIEWSSLSNPLKIIEIAEHYYEILYVQAIDIPYGIYTEDSSMKKHIFDQHLKDMAALAINDDGTIGWTFIGTVLRRK